MQSFADLDRLLALVPGHVVTQLSEVDVGRGRADLFRNQLPALLGELADRARIASITASSALEGVVVPDPARAAAIIRDRTTTLRTRSEQELAGYRSALDHLFAGDWRPLNAGLLLHLHGELFGHTEVVGGRWKEVDDLVVDRSPDGTVAVRFVPVLAARTPEVTADLLARYSDALDARRHHPVLLTGLLVLDLLTVHPFEDGNGRVATAGSSSAQPRTGRAGRSSSASGSTSWSTPPRSFGSVTSGPRCPASATRRSGSPSSSCGPRASSPRRDAVEPRPGCAGAVEPAPGARRDPARRSGIARVVEPGRSSFCPERPNPRVRAERGQTTWHRARPSGS